MTTTGVVVVTGASRGLGRALADRLVDDGWHVVADGRDAGTLARAARRWGSRATPLPGDVADDRHRRDLVEAAAAAGGATALVNNASELGPSPQPRLADYPLDVLRHVYEVDVVAPLALVQALLPQLLQARDAGGVVVDLSSDAAVEAYEGWGGYGSAKAALDQLTGVLAAEHPGLHVYSLDPGDMRTEMHQRAFPGEDISGRPDAATVVPAALELLAARLPSGRYRAADLGVPA
jgi:NAD(P)-dependent dehydrogenase (short-subunit alcohol dehydrogenase family)